MAEGFRWHRASKRYYRLHLNGKDMALLFAPPEPMSVWCGVIWEEGPTGTVVGQSVDLYFSFSAAKRAIQSKCNEMLTGRCA